MSDGFLKGNLSKMVLTTTHISQDLLFIETGKKVIFGGKKSCF